jgi:Protein of unknown function (DUF3137)
MSLWLHERQLGVDMQKLRERAQSATQTSDLVSAIKTLSGHTTPIPIEARPRSWVPTLFAASSMLNIALASLFFILLLWLLFSNAESGVTWVHKILLLSGIALFIYFEKKHIKRYAANSNKSDSISLLLRLKRGMFESGLIEVTVDPRKHRASLATHFSEFKSLFDGKIHYWLEGNISEAQKNYTYHCFKYEYDAYVDKQIASFTRYGFILNFPFARSIQIYDSGNGEGNWTSPSVYFNQSFSVQASDKLEVTKFLLPAILEKILELGKYTKNLSLEFNEAGHLCIAFSDFDPISCRTQHDLRYPDRFADEITRPVRQEVLKHAVDLMHTLIRFSDDNFEQRNQ